MPTVLNTTHYHAARFGNYFSVLDMLALGKSYTFQCSLYDGGTLAPPFLDQHCTSPVMELVNVFFWAFFRIQA